MMLDLLNSLQETSSRNKKEELLSELDSTQTEQFKRVAWMTYDPSIDYYIKEFEPATEFDDVISLADALQDLENIIAKRQFTGNQAKQWVEMNHGLLSEEDAEVFKRVIKRDLRCGVSAKTINKIWPNTIYEHPYMRASSFSEKNLKNISFPCISQTKMDGLYCDVIVTEDKVEYRSRNGSYLLFNSNSDETLIEACPNMVLMGEALAYNESMTDLMSRKESNGYLNSNEIDTSRIVFYFWDMVSLDEFENKKSTQSYKNRFDSLTSLVNDSLMGRFKVVDSVECQTKQDILDHFKQKREEGEEGTVIKDMKMQWKPGTSKHQIKCKVIFDCDLKVVGYKLGTGKHEGKLGALTCQTSDGLLEVSVGGGFKDLEREEFLDLIDDWIESEQIVTVRGNDVVTNQSNPDMYSIFLPRFVELRGDKTEADSLERVQEQVKAFTDALDMIK